MLKMTYEKNDNNDIVDLDFIKNKTTSQFKNFGKNSRTQKIQTLQDELSKYLMTGITTQINEEEIIEEVEN